MATFKLSIARMQNCPPLAELDAAMGEFGLPEGEEFGVLSHSTTGQAAFATLVRKTQAAVPRVDPETHEVTAAAVEKATVYPLAFHPAREVVEIHAGAASAIEQVGAFLGSCLALPTVVEPIEIDVASAVDKLRENVRRFVLRGVRVSEYAHNSYMSGPYAPKFLDSEHGRDFLAEYAEFVRAASVRFQTQTGRANVGLAPTARFSYSCNEDDQAEVQDVLRRLV